MPNTTGDRVLGVTFDGVPVMGRESEAADGGLPLESIAPGFVPMSRSDTAITSTRVRVLGTKWDCTEFVRRYLLSRSGVMLKCVGAPEDICEAADAFISIVASPPKAVKATYIPNPASSMPQVGDILVWKRCDAYLNGHAAVVVEVKPDCVMAAEQWKHCERFKHGEHFNRTLHVNVSAGSFSLEGGDGFLGFVHVDAPPLSSESDFGDDFRILTGRGRVFRQPVPQALSLPWNDPTVPEGEPAYYLRRSLLEKDGLASPVNAPSGFYHMDYNMWCRLRNGAQSLHRIALQATEKVILRSDSTVLEKYFGIPPELHPLLKQSWETTPALTGRFDFGIDAHTIKLLEYNCDSSGALLECCETQQRMAEYYGIEDGCSTGAAMRAKLVLAFQTLIASCAVCHKHRLIHFLIDDDDEERYTAMYMMACARDAGFRVKLFTSPSQLAFKEASASRGRDEWIIDPEGERVLVVWKTWSWDTVLHQYLLAKSTNQHANPLPTLPDVLLNETILVFEPLWKAVTGSKAILPFMYELAPDHENLLPCSFELTETIASKPYISKPVNGRAGQNISMYNGASGEGHPTPEEIEESERRESEMPIDGCTSRQSNSSYSREASYKVCDEDVQDNENSSGRFYESVLVYQQRHFLRKFGQKYFPIFCGWMIFDEFGGSVVREDTSKITTLESLVAPARVVRSDSHFHEQQRKFPEGNEL